MSARVRERTEGGGWRARSGGGDAGSAVVMVEWSPAGGGGAERWGMPSWCGSALGEAACAFEIGSQKASLSQPEKARNLKACSQRVAVAGCKLGPEQSYCELLKKFKACNSRRLSVDCTNPACNKM